mmetsp:Transcript_45203/g.51006  ORF Transcript_45203/g.51006 Transcript_45203/m.51006 type:complete len:113 (+) Transcript_45203:128-466(+)
MPACNINSIMDNSIAMGMGQEEILWSTVLEKLFPKFKNKQYLSYLINHYKNGTENQLKSPFKRQFAEISPPTKDDGAASKINSTKNHTARVIDFDATAERKAMLEHYAMLPE